MTIQTQKIAIEMLRICETVNLPKHYATDISIDVFCIINSNADQFVWLLRDNGSSILPVEQGAEPITITYYIEGIGRDSSAKTFLIDSRTCAIKEIPLTQATIIAHRPPMLDISAAPNLIMGQVQQVLEQGCNNRLWGVFNPPKSADQFSFSGWTQYFLENGNQPMIDFMRQAFSAICSEQAVA